MNNYKHTFIIGDLNYKILYEYLETISNNIYIVSHKDNHPYNHVLYDKLNVKPESVVVFDEIYTIKYMEYGIIDEIKNIIKSADKVILTSKLFVDSSYDMYNDLNLIYDLLSNKKIHISLDELYDIKNFNVIFGDEFKVNVNNIFSSSTNTPKLINQGGVKKELYDNMDYYNANDKIDELNGLINKGGLNIVYLKYYANDYTIVDKYNIVEEIYKFNSSKNYTLFFLHNTQSHYYLKKYLPMIQHIDNIYFPHVFYDSFIEQQIILTFMDKTLDKTNLNIYRMIVKNNYDELGYKNSLKMIKFNNHIKDIFILN